MSLATAHANIAVVKYWGKQPQTPELNLPAVPSVSVTLDALSTTTEVVFGREQKQDDVFLNDVPADPKFSRRVSAFLDRIRDQFDIADFARVSTSNNFPTAAGLASSASGFAALTTAAVAATGAKLDPERLSGLARQGSGSAARSIFGGYVEMLNGTTDETSVARQIAPADHWDLSCVICLTAKGAKKIGSTEAMEATRVSAPYYEAWIADTVTDVENAKTAIEHRDFEALAQIAERSCLRMHACAMAADPGILYWRPGTVALIHAVRDLRERVPCFFTIDAGPHVKVFCKTDDVERVVASLENESATRDIIVSAVGGDAQVLS